jgi:hypothetical protein
MIHQTTKGMVGINAQAKDLARKSKEQQHQVEEKKDEKGTGQGKK